ncbi:hypothetical protein SAMN05421837_102776 [Amycolatopsis pretoriensis]|uniref:HSP18 transcriptional regulator n=1 Tax=Amycolatopsis pretoriensis TaxID=218821 RepID=A0A1H5QEM5_9PSEU|nr:HSP18 transcriptional regulator [Amycolatopsis pretoriensis]SEF24582.1 hypothetical protein SAMN05421837_102776 [Amycolatopsis pretoriensis]
MVDVDPVRAVQDLRSVVLAADRGEVSPDRLLAALASLRSLREKLAGWEPQLIAAARSEGTSWAALAPALGVASRQAAERRFLRLRPSATGEPTGEARVEAERGRRAGDRAVAEWARRNAAVLRQLAGQVTALEDLDGEARAYADRLGAALGKDDVTSLLPPLTAVRGHLERDHTGLAGRLGTIENDADLVRRDATGHRRDRTS